MRTRHLQLGIATAAAVLLASATVAADDLDCGIKAGDSVGAYKVIKCGGIDDGIDVGKQLCYL